MISGMFTAPLAGTTNGVDSPETVRPLITHVARARTGPKLAGTFGRIHVPSGLARTFRLRTLTVQCSLRNWGVAAGCCASAGIAHENAISAANARRRRRACTCVTVETEATCEAGIS